jgi:hypothetical protein
MYGSSKIPFLGLIALLSSITTAQEVECWAPDGITLADNTTYVPCNKLGITQEGVYSSCCNLDGEPGERDLCTTTGLCLNNGVLHRGFCTDKNWDSPACVKVCLDEDVSQKPPPHCTYNVYSSRNTDTFCAERRIAKWDGRDDALRRWDILLWWQY